MQTNKTAAQIIETLKGVNPMTQTRYNPIWAEQFKYELLKGVSLQRALEDAIPDHWPGYLVRKIAGNYQGEQI
jgi:hypothetical protein